MKGDRGREEPWSCQRQTRCAETWLVGKPRGDAQIKWGWVKLRCFCVIILGV